MKDFSQDSAATVDSAGFAVGAKPSGAAAGQKAPDFQNRKRPFRLAANPKSWELVKLDIGWRFIPTLKMLWLHPGANWTELPKKASMGIDASNLEAKARSRWNDTVLVNIDEYMRVYEGVGNTKGYFLTWERVRVYNDGEHHVTTDTDAYAKWCYGLVERGIVAPPRQSAIDFERNRWNKRLKRYRNSTKGNFDHLIKAAEERLAGVEEAVRALGNIGAAPMIVDAAAPPTNADLEAMIAKLQAELAEAKAAQPKRRSRKADKSDEAGSAEEAA